MKLEFDEFQLTSKEYDLELEAALDDYKEREAEMQGEQERIAADKATLEGKVQRQEAEIERIERELAKVQHKYKTEVTIVEKENDEIKLKMEDISK